MSDRPGYGRCCAYLADGRVCGRPGVRVDLQRGGVVCAAHARPEAEPSENELAEVTRRRRCQLRRFVRFPDGTVVPYAK